MIKIKEIKIHGLSIPFKKNIQTTWSKRSGTTIFLIELTTSNNIKGFGEMISFFKPEIGKITLERMIEDKQQEDYLNFQFYPQYQFWSHSVHFSSP